jgi:hypothetical protein
MSMGGGYKLSKKGVMEDLTIEGRGRNLNVFEKAREDIMEESKSSE